MPDGSRVWLNADSKLTFSTNIIANGTLRVNLEGEAYFEVAKDKQHPFVQSKGQEIEVLGTHFNVTAYPDDLYTNTTLLEGKVEVSTPQGNQTILSPGQQAINQNGSLRTQRVNAQEAVAWKNGEFIFNDEPLESIMLKIAIWYNVENEFRDSNLKKKTFGGSISKFKDVSDVLRMLALTKDVDYHPMVTEVLLICLREGRLLGAT